MSSPIKTNSKITKQPGAPKKPMKLSTILDKMGLLKQEKAYTEHLITKQPNNIMLPNYLTSVSNQIDKYQDMIDTCNYIKDTCPGCDKNGCVCKYR